MNVRAWLFRSAAMAAGVFLMAAAGAAGYRFVLADARAEVYRQRLIELTQDYESLRSTYNQVVKRTAVTELVVRGNELAVRVTSAEGVEREIPTPFDPADEIYVDFVVRDGRLLIRRIFDAKTSPQAGLVISQDLTHVHWSEGWSGEPPSRAVRYGKAVYRRLGEGRWVVSVTGDGSLGLVRADRDEQTPLTAAPPVRDFEEIEKEARDRAKEVGLRDLLLGLVDGK